MERTGGHHHDTGNVTSEWHEGRAEELRKREQARAAPLTCLHTLRRTRESGHDDAGDCRVDRRDVGADVRSIRTLTLVEA